MDTAVFNWIIIFFEQQSTNDFFLLLFCAIEMLSLSDSFMWQHLDLGTHGMTKFRCSQRTCIHYWNSQIYEIYACIMKRILHVKAITQLVSIGGMLGLRFHVCRIKLLCLCLLSLKSKIFKNKVTCTLKGSNTMTQCFQIK
jgi:hypothetical protein